MKKKLIVLGCLLVVLFFIGIICKEFFYTDENIIFDTSKELSKFGKVTENISLENQVISYDEYYWDETTMEYAKNKFLTLSAHYSTTKTSGYLEIGDGAYVQIYVFDKDKIVYQDIGEIYQDSIDFYSLYYNDMIGKEVGTTSMFDFEYDSNSTLEKQSWMEENVSYFVSIKLISILEKEIPILNEENLKQYIVPKMEELYNKKIEIETIQEYEEFVRLELETQVQEKNKNNDRNAITRFIEYQFENVVVNEEFANEYAHKIMLPYFERLAKDLNMSIDEYAMEYWGVDKEVHLNEIGILEMKKNTVILELAKEMNIDIQKEEFEKYKKRYFEIFSKMNGTTIQEEQIRFESYPYSFYFTYLQEMVFKSIGDYVTFSVNKISY